MAQPNRLQPFNKFTGSILLKLDRNTVHVFYFLSKTTIKASDTLKHQPTVWPEPGIEVKKRSESALPAGGVTKFQASFVHVTNVNILINCKLTFSRKPLCRNHYLYMVA